MWVRGLKLIVYVKLIMPHGVAPHVGAWIETHSFAQYCATT